MVMENGSEREGELTEGGCDDRGVIQVSDGKTLKGEFKQVKFEKSQRTTLFIYLSVFIYFYIHQHIRYVEGCRNK